MRAKDFIVETQRGKPLDAHAKVSPGAAFTTDGYLDLYRASAMMARMPSDADDIDPYSFVSGLPLIVTYTDQEKEMVKAAFKKMGIPYQEHITSDSEEPDGINSVSPAAPNFKGY